LRVLCTSIFESNGVVVADNTIKLEPDESVLHHEVRDEIMLSESDFSRLSEAFFAEIEKKYGLTPRRQESVSHEVVETFQLA
jgi:hypothetical protein